jgi:hypothetical protein
MKTIRGYAVAVLLIAAGLGALAQAGQRADEKVFQDIKRLVFDEKWTDARSMIEEFLARYPQSSYGAQVLYYRSKCLEKQDGHERAALASYKEYLRVKDGNTKQVEDAEVAIIELAMKLYDAGDKTYLQEVEERISSPNKVVRYYAAVQLSYVKEKRIADRSVPVLKQIILEEKDPELRDRAKIALMRVSPDALAGLEEPRADKKPRMLRIFIQGEKNEKFEFSIPWALADLALAALSEEDKAALRAKGYDIARIVRDLQSTKGTIIEINAEGKRFRIWIE